MKGWFTADVEKVAETIKEHGKLKILDDNSLIVEMKDFITTEVLSGRLKELFGEEVWIEYLPKSNNRNIIAE